MPAGFKSGKVEIQEVEVPVGYGLTWETSTVLLLLYPVASRRAQFKRKEFRPHLLMEECQRIWGDLLKSPHLHLENDGPMCHFSAGLCNTFLLANIKDHLPASFHPLLTSPPN